MTPFTRATFMATRGVKRKRVSDGDSAGSGGWSFGLLRAMDDPGQQIESDEDMVIIRDKFPKARHHYLVLSRRDIQGLTDITGNDVPLLESMLARGKQLVEKIKEKERKAQFRLGYHALPSMRRLHMHVISQDFDSPCLKHKKHWNSFASAFFMDAVDVIEKLKEKGRITIDKDLYEGLLKESLKCHVCKQLQPNMPKLKDHIGRHNN